MAAGEVADVEQVRVGVVITAVLALAVAGPPPAAEAHMGDSRIEPTLEQIEPEIPDLHAEVAFTANYQFVVENPSANEVVILADTGEPFVRIGSEGAFGNFNSPSWYNSNVPDGLLPEQIPERAEAGADVEPAWVRVSREPSWGWYDHRLHPGQRVLDEEVLEATETVDLGPWEVPIRYGDTEGRIRGRFEYKPQLGIYESRLRSPERPVEGVRVGVVSAQIPAIYLENTSERTVTVLGMEDEPFVRIGPHVEVNLHSPTYVRMEQAEGRTPTAEADADLAPQWRRIQESPRWRWLEFRAAPPEGDPRQEWVRREDPTTVKTWDVPVIIGEDRSEISGITQFVPIAEARARAGGELGNGTGSSLPLLAGIGLVTGAVGYLVLKPGKGKKAAAGHRH